MRKGIAILLLIPFHTMHAQEPTTGIAGVYYLQGVMETASVLELKPDSSFTFFFSYGALDRFGSGKWSLQHDQIVLNSRVRPAVDFKLTSSEKKDDGFITVRISDNNEHLLRYVDCIVKTRSGEEQATTDREGIARFPKKEIDSILLLFTLCPDRYSSFPVTDKQQNDFTFRFEPWIVEIFFDQFRLQYQKNLLTGKHPLLEGNHFTYIKEKE